jgi:hypothetical protein
VTGSVLVALRRLEIGRFEPANLLITNREEVPQSELILSKTGYGMAMSLFRGRRTKGRLFAGEGPTNTRSRWLTPITDVEEFRQSASG